MAVDRNTVVKEAQKFASKGQFDKAIAEWRKLVKESPKDPNLFNTIGDLCLKKNAKAEAVEAYRRAADLLAEDGFASKAIALYKKVLNIDPNQISVHLALGDMNAEKGLTGNALENYKHVADHYSKQNKKADALRIYQKMADLNPANVGFRVKLAGMYVKEGMKPEAVKAHLDAAEQHIIKNEFQEARKMFEKVLELDPQNKDVYHKAGVVYFKEGKLDEARKALRRAFEAHPDNTELMNLYLEVLEKTGRSGDAEDIYRKLLSLDPSRFELHERIYRILLDKKAFDRALAEAAIIAENKAESMDFAGAAEVLKELIAVTTDPLSAASALADLYGKRGRAQDGARELVLAAEGLIDRGAADNAREVLNRALLLSPDLPEAKEKLSSMGGGEAAAAKLEEVDFGGAVIEEAPPPVEEAPKPAAAPRAPAPQAPPAEAEDPRIAGALSEADVLIKYGLGAKAIQQLEDLVRSHPEHVRVRTLLLDLYRQEKQPDKAVIQALMLAEMHEKRGQMEESRSVLRAALELAPGNRQIMARLGIEPEAEAPEAIETIEELETIESPAEEQPEGVPDLGALEIPEEPEELALQDADGVTPSPAFPVLDTDETAFTDEEVEELPPSPPPPRAARPRGPVREPVKPPKFEEPLEKEPLAQTDTTELWAEAEFYYQQGLFDEARKQYEMILELNPGDQRAMSRIVEITREKEDVQEFSRLAEAVEGLESIVSSGGKTPAETATPADVDAVRSLMNELTQLRGGKAATPSAKTPKPAPPAAEQEESFAGLMDDVAPRTPEAPVRQRPADVREESFADLAREMERARPAPAQQGPEEEDASADFFDLAAELKDELSAATPSKTPAAGQEQSLDEIFEEFKAGVEAHEKKEDEDTHYNLGIAYREMGLLDDAISEFNMTSEGEPKYIQSRYLLGLCFLEKGDYETAITEIQKALGYSYSFGEAGEERTGMHYDLGLAYQGVGNNTGALEEFQKVYNLDPSYREVASKVKELQEGEYISLDSIKEDIEKEISFKFLEEGARIEREEKTRKTKK